jgi:hypothetical protein
VSSPHAPQPVKLIASILTADLIAADRAIEMMRQQFGETDYVSDPLAFDFTDYYTPEMGAGLHRRLISFAGLIMPDELPDIKLATNSLEREFASADGKRVLNIDPGYIALCHLILATGKAFTHRPYLRDGIYADMTLVYRRGRFQTLEWTFPDYASPEMLDSITMLRERYYQQLQQLPRAHTGDRQCCKA